VKRPKNKKKYYTIDEANATLPLLRSILRDITTLAQDLQERQERLVRLQKSGAMDRLQREEVEEAIKEFEIDSERLRGYEEELRKLHVELKDYFTGLVDFLARIDGRDVYLCWRLGEPEVAHWHDLNAGFAGRQKLVPANV